MQPFNWILASIWLQLVVPPIIGAIKFLLCQSKGVFCSVTLSPFRASFMGQGDTYRSPFIHFWIASREAPWRMCMGEMQSSRPAGFKSRPPNWQAKYLHCSPMKDSRCCWYGFESRYCLEVSRQWHTWAPTESYIPCGGSSRLNGLKEYNHDSMGTKHLLTLHFALKQLGQEILGLLVATISHDQEVMSSIPLTLTSYYFAREPAIQKWSVHSAQK